MASKGMGIKTSVKSGNFRPTKAGAGMTKKGVTAYRKANPGSKLKTAVTSKNPTAAEAKRRQDLIRFGVFHRKSWFSHKPSATFRNIFPIPANSLLTNTNLKQNPGY